MLYNEAKINHLNTFFHKKCEFYAVEYIRAKKKSEMLKIQFVQLYNLSFEIILHRSIFSFLYQLLTLINQKNSSAIFAVYNPNFRQVDQWIPYF